MGVDAMRVSAAEVNRCFDFWSWWAGVRGMEERMAGQIRREDVMDEQAKDRGDVEVRVVAATMFKAEVMLTVVPIDYSIVMSMTFRVPIDHELAKLREGMTRVIRVWV